MAPINNLCHADGGNGMFLTMRVLIVYLIVAKNGEHSQLTFIFLCLSILVNAQLPNSFFFLYTVGLKKKSTFDFNISEISLLLNCLADLSVVSLLALVQDTASLLVTES